MTSGDYPQWTEVTIEAVPGDGFRFSGWAVNNAYQEDWSQTHSFKLVEDTRVMANFVREEEETAAEPDEPAPAADKAPAEPKEEPQVAKVRFTLESSDGGRVDSTPPPGDYQKGETIAIQAIPNEGFEFKCWESNSTPLDPERFGEAETFTLEGNTFMKAVFIRTSDDAAGGGEGK
jgi:hypothetical protein